MYIQLRIKPLQILSSSDISSMAMLQKVEILALARTSKLQISRDKSSLLALPVT